MTDMKAESLADLSTEQSTYNKSLTDLKTEDMSRSPPLTDLSPEPLIVTGVQNPQTDDGKDKDNDLPKTVKILNQKEQVGKSCWPTVEPKGCHTSTFGDKFSKLRRKKSKGHQQISQQSQRNIPSLRPIQRQNHQLSQAYKKDR